MNGGAVRMGGNMSGEREESIAIEGCFDDILAMKATAHLHLYEPLSMLLRMQDHASCNRACKLGFGYDPR